MRLDVAVAVEFEREQVMQFVGESPRISARPVRRDLPSGRVDVDLERVGAGDIDELEVGAVALGGRAFSMASFMPLMALTSLVVPLPVGMSMISALTTMSVGEVRVTK
jgi:hypothetical protein